MFGIVVFSFSVIFLFAAEQERADGVLLESGKSDHETHILCLSFPIKENTESLESGKIIASQLILLHKRPRVGR